MPGRGYGYHRRLFFLERIGEEDPDLYAELMELRKVSPQKFRKRLRTLADGKGRVGPSRLHSSPVPWDEAEDVTRLTLTLDREARGPGAPARES